MQRLLSACKRGLGCLMFVGPLMWLARTPADGADKFPPASELPQQADLPDPLVRFNGQKVRSADEWRSQRRDELKQLFQHYMYGYAPPAPKQVIGKVERRDEKYFGGKATKKEVTISWGDSK